MECPRRRKWLRFDYSDIGVSLQISKDIDQLFDEGDKPLIKDRIGPYSQQFPKTSLKAVKSGRCLIHAIRKYTAEQYETMNYNCQLFTCRILTQFKTGSPREKVEETVLNLPDASADDIGE